MASTAALPAPQSPTTRAMVDPAALSLTPAPQALAPRIVQREGILVDTISIQAPSRYKLKSVETRRDLNFLLPASPEIRLTLYRGQRVVVTGEERTVPRQPGLPLIEVRKIGLAP